MSARIALFFGLVLVGGCASSKPTSGGKGALVVPVLPDALPACSTAKAKPGVDTIVRVELTGNARTPTKTLCDYLRTQAGHAFDPAHIATDVHELFSSGYVDDIIVSSQVDDEGRTVTFTVRERPLVKEFVANVVAPSPTVEHLREIFGHAGDIFNGAALRIAKVRLHDEYVAQGYRRVAIEHRVTPAPDNQVVVTIDVTPGPKALITSIRFPGAKQIPESEVLGLIETEQGTVDTVGAIYRQDLFDHSLLLVSAHYYDRGMLSVKVDTPVLTSSADGTGLAISVPIDEGPIFKIGALSCVGDLAGSEAECLVLLGVKKSDVFNRAALLDGISRIRDFQSLKGRGTDIQPETSLDFTAKTVALKLVIAR